MFERSSALYVFSIKTLKSPPTLEVFSKILLIAGKLPIEEELLYSSIGRAKDSNALGRVFDPLLGCKYFLTCEL
jgi:hypothetical protein